MRGTWFCSAQCFEKAFTAILARLLSSSVPARTATHRIPLGLMMVSRGLVSYEQLQCALEAQRRSGCGRIGDWLQSLGFASEQQVTSALSVQWACPVFSLRQAVEPRFLQILPLALSELDGMLPVHYLEATGTLYVAFSTGIDYTVLHAAEQMLGCRTEPCLVLRSALKRELDRARLFPRPTELVFETVADVAEMARIVRSYVLRLGAEEARMMICRSYIWVRLNSNGQAMNLLFRAPAAERRLQA